MISFLDNRSNRLSTISSTSTLSNDSGSSQASILFYRLISKLNLTNDKTEVSSNNESKKKVSSSRQILFFGPLVLFILLLISGVIMFIIVGQRNIKDEKKTKPEKNLKKYFDTIDSKPDHDFQPVSCPIITSKRLFQQEFVLHELKCGLRRSSLIHMSYVNDSCLIKPGVSIDRRDLEVAPKVELNFNFLMKLHYNSFILLLIDPKLVELSFYNEIILHWIRYFSFSMEDGNDICRYRNINSGLINQQKIVLLYATNSSIMVIRAKTICVKQLDSFYLTDYVEFVKLKLIGATNFLIRPQSLDDESDED